MCGVVWVALNFDLPHISPYSFIMFCHSTDPFLVYCFISSVYIMIMVGGGGSSVDNSVSLNVLSISIIFSCPLPVW